MSKLRTEREKKREVALPSLNIKDKLWSVYAYMCQLQAKIMILIAVRKEVGHKFHSILTVTRV